MRSHVALIVAALAAPVSAQWSSDPAANLLIDDSANEQVQPKIVPGTEGGFYISWYDTDPTGSPAFGYDVRIQRLDVEGNEVWPAGGVLVADRGYSSTQDYGLGVDASGNALLAFRDDRLGGTQITAAKVDLTGTLVWGAGGVQVTSTTDFLAAPKITGTTDGEVVVAWKQNANVVLQRLDANGVAQWGAGVTLTPGAGDYSVSDLHAGEAATAVLSFIHQTGGFGSPRHILAQKFDAVGALQWGAAHVAVFDGGSLQFGNFPTFVPDGSGGGVFGWYENSPLQCRAQHILANGTEAFPHNGSVGSTNGIQLRVSPSVDFDPVSGETFMFWTELNGAQSMFGVYGQKFDAGGTRQWSSSGQVVVSVAAAQKGWVRTVAALGGAWVSYIQGPAFGAQEVVTTFVTNTGGLTPALVASSVASSKTRLVATANSSGVPGLVWQDDRLDTGIYAQNVNHDGTLGAAGGPYCFGTDALCPCANGGASNTGCDIQQSTGGVELSLAGFAPNGGGGGQVTFAGTGFPSMSTPAALMIRATAPENPAVVFGDGLRCVGVPVVRFGAAFANAGASVHTSGHGAGAGTFSYQIWFRNQPIAFCDPAAAFNLSNGYTLTW
jgi:hypothetical protein